MKPELHMVELYHDDRGGWVAQCPLLPNCFRQGATREEAIENVLSAMKCYVSVMESEGLPVFTHPDDPWCDVDWVID